jgi:hypothetical protein
VKRTSLALSLLLLFLVSCGPSQQEEREAAETLAAEETRLKKEEVKRNADEKGLICKHTSNDASVGPYSWHEFIHFYIDTANLKVRHFTDLYPEWAGIETCIQTSPDKCTKQVRGLIKDFEFDLKPGQKTLSWVLREEDKYSRYEQETEFFLNRETLELTRVLHVNWMEDNYKYACRLSTDKEIEDSVRKANEAIARDLEDLKKRWELKSKKSIEKNKI